MNPQEYQDYINNRKPEQLANDTIFRNLLLIGLATLIVTVERQAQAFEQMAAIAERQEERELEA